MDKEDEIVKTGNIMCETCQRNKQQNLAKAFCVQCQEYMCGQCSEYHFRSTQTRHHRMIKDTEMPIWKSSTSVAELCSVHNGEICHFYCESHNTLICYICNRYIHMKCKNVRLIKELSHNISISKRYLNTREGVKQMSEVFQTLKTQLVGKLHATCDNYTKPCDNYSKPCDNYTKTSDTKTAERTHTTNADGGEQIQNLINTYEERIQKDEDEIRHLIYLCDAEIYKAETVNSNFNILQETKQDVQLYIAIKDAEDVLKHMTQVRKDIAGTIEKKTCVKLDIEEPESPSKDTLKFNYYAFYPRSLVECRIRCCSIFMMMYFPLFSLCALLYLLSKRQLW